jgi:hypothetical protein
MPTMLKYQGPVDCGTCVGTHLNIPAPHLHLDHTYKYLHDTYIYLHHHTYTCAQTLTYIYLHY